MTKLLHIAAHLGGGAGKAISGILKSLVQYENTLLLLEEPKDTKYVEICKQNGIDIIISSEVSEIKELALNADCVVLNWWCHPLCFNVFRALDDIGTRVVLWSHINGLHYPYISTEFVDIFDGVMFTSACTYSNEFWEPKKVVEIKEKSEVVYGMGEFYPEHLPYKTDYTIKDKIQIGYIGTVDFSKMNSDFPSICHSIYQKVNNVEFVFYGKHTEEFKQEFLSQYSELESCVKFMGFVENIPEKLIKCDIFLYPLTSENFATTENALIEAMAAGLSVVVLNNSAEREIVADGITGFVSDSPEEVAETVIKLCANELLRKKIGMAARADIISEYNYDDNCGKFVHCVNNALKNPKHTHEFSQICGDDIWNWFLYFSGKYKNIIVADDINSIGKMLPKIFYSESKSSPYHYHHYYPENEKLSDMIKSIEKEYCK